MGGKEMGASTWLIFMLFFFYSKTFLPLCPANKLCVLIRKKNEKALTTSVGLDYWFSSYICSSPPANPRSGPICSSSTHCFFKNLHAYYLPSMAHNQNALVFCQLTLPLSAQSLETNINLILLVASFHRAFQTNRIKLYVPSLFFTFSSSARTFWKMVPL